MYFQGTLPLISIKRYLPTDSDNNRFRLCSRQVHSNENQPNGMAFRNCASVVVPRFASEHVRANMLSLYGISIHRNCNDNEVDYTYTASTFPDSPPIPQESVHLWSSYKYVSRSNTRRRYIHLYFTLRQFYGENVTLSRTRNPVLLLP